MNIQTMRNGLSEAGLLTSLLSIFAHIHTHIHVHLAIIKATMGIEHRVHVMHISVRQKQVVITFSSLFFYFNRQKAMPNSSMSKRIFGPTAQWVSSMSSSARP